MTNRALIFDFDGLILDTEGTKALAWQEIFREQGVELEFSFFQDTVGMIGLFTPKAKAHLEQRLGRSVDFDPLVERFQRRHHQLISQLTPLPGVASLMTEGRRQGYRIGLATSGPRDWAGPWLDRHGLTSQFHSLMTGDRLTHLKPHPEAYLRCLEELGAVASESWAFEDSLIGATAAKKAGLKVAVVPNKVTRHQDFSFADLVLDSLQDFRLI